MPQPLGKAPGQGHSQAALAAKHIPAGVVKNTVKIAVFFLRTHQHLEAFTLPKNNTDLFSAIGRINQAQLPDLHFCNQEPHLWPASTLRESGCSDCKASKEQFELFRLRNTVIANPFTGSGTASQQPSARQPPAHTGPRHPRLKKSPRA